MYEITTSLFSRSCMMRDRRASPKIETGLQPLGASADFCPGGVKEDDAMSIRNVLVNEVVKEQLEQVVIEQLEQSEVLPIW